MCEHLYCAKMSTFTVVPVVPVSTGIYKIGTCAEAKLKTNFCCCLVAFHIMGKKCLSDKCLRVLAA